LRCIDPNQSVLKEKYANSVRSAYVGNLVWTAFMGLLLVAATHQTAIADPASGSSGEPAVIFKIEIKALDGKDHAAEWAKIARDVILLYVAEGDPFSAVRVAESLAALKACGSFRRIDADTRENQHGITLTYAVTPFRLVKEIIIKGKYPLFENKILNAMTIYPGDAYEPAVAAAQAELVADLYRKEGFIDPDVVIGVWEDPDDGNYILFVTIDKGAYYSLGRIVFKGNRSFDDSVLKWRMKSWRKAIFGRAMGRFKQRLHKKDMESIEKFYRKQQFFDARVAHKLSGRPGAGMMDVEITVDEGPRYDILFKGNQYRSDYALRKQLVLKETGNRGGVGLRKSIKNIKAFYRKNGFPETRIDVLREETVDEQGRKRIVHLVIDEGPRLIVSRLDIAGNTAYSERKLKRQFLTRSPGFLHEGAYVDEILEEDLLMIQNLYQRKGYLHPEMAVEKAAVPIEENVDHVAIDLRIEEGTRTIVSTVEFEGLAALPVNTVLEKIEMKPGRPFRRYALRNDEKTIAQAISEKGRPYVIVESDTLFSEDKSMVQVIYKVDEGPLVTMGRTHYHGNFRTKKRILDREIEMKPGEPFSLQKMYVGQQNIRAMNIFRSVQFKPVGLGDRRDKIHLFAKIDEEPPYYFQASAGYESVKGFYAGSKLGDHNFWGLNKDLSLEAEVSQTGYWAESRLFEPRFWGTRISSDLGVFLEWKEPFNQTFATRKYGADLYFSRKLTNSITGSLGFRFERRRQLNQDDSIDVEDDFDDPRSVFTTSPSIGYDSRDSFIRPREGIFSFLAVDLSKGIENSFDDFYKYRFELRGFTTPYKRLTFAGRGSFGDINPYGAEGVVPQDQLFYLGGTASVRGFDNNLFLYDSEKNPVGGERAAVGSVEARVDLGRNFELSVFYDIGYLDDTSGREVTDNVRDSVGTGLRYVTPIGAIGVLYGHKLDPRPEESRGRMAFLCWLYLLDLRPTGWQQAVKGGLEPQGVRNSNSCPVLKLNTIRPPWSDT
jgi:outer membrane protein insertion porin family